MSVVGELVQIKIVVGITSPTTYSTRKDSVMKPRNKDEYVGDLAYKILNLSIDELYHLVYIIWLSDTHKLEAFKQYYHLFETKQAGCNCEKSSVIQLPERPSVSSGKKPNPTPKELMEVY